MHAALAMLTKSPELMLEDGEAKALAEALAEVNRHFPTSINPKYAALMNLGAVAGMIYVPRILNMRKRIRGGGGKNGDNSLTDNVAIFNDFSGMDAHASA